MGGQTRLVRFIERGPSIDRFQRENMASWKLLEAKIITGFAPATEIHFFFFFFTSFSFSSGFTPNRFILLSPIWAFGRPSSFASSLATYLPVEPSFRGGSVALKTAATVWEIAIFKWRSSVKWPSGKLYTSIVLVRFLLLFIFIRDHCGFIWNQLLYPCPFIIIGKKTKKSYRL